MVGLNPQSCIQLFEIALQSGFTTMHSYLMFNEDFPLLNHSYDIMEASNRYSMKQLEFISTMLIAQPVHWGLKENGGLVIEFDENDRKRYSHVVIESEVDDPQLKFTALNWSENGLLTGGRKFRDRLSLDHDEVMSLLSEGDHLIRYFNTPYAERHGQATWIPVLMRNGDIIEPPN